MQYFKSTLLIIFIAFIFTETTEAQSKLDGYFFSGSISYDVMMISENTFPPYDPDLYLFGFWSRGIEIGKRKERKAYSLYFRFGKNILESDLTVFDGLDDEFEVERYMQLGAVYRLQFNKYRETDSKLLFNLGVRNMASVANFTGKQLIDAYNANARLINYNQATVSIESGLYLEVGRNAGNKPGFFLNIEPLYIAVTNKGLGAGGFKVSGIVQL